MTDACIRVNADDYDEIVRERNQLRRQVTELQATATARLEASLPRVVRAFHTKFSHPIATTPHVPSDDVVRFRASLIAEEFFELLEALFDVHQVYGYYEAQRTIRGAISGAYPYQRAPVDVDLPEAMDALTDLDFVSEGTRAVFGVDGAPILAEVARANSEKGPNGPNGKPTKGPTWRGPDVRGCLIAQGWRPDVATGTPAAGPDGPRAHPGDETPAEGDVGAGNGGGK